MIATVDIADLGVRRGINTLRHRPTTAAVPGLRWLDVSVAGTLGGANPLDAQRVAPR